MPQEPATQRFEVIEEEAGVSAAEEQLKKRFQDAASWTGTRKLGYQGGNAEETVWWVADEGVWFAGMKLEDRWWNPLGTSDPKQSDGLSITVEINPPVRGVNRRLAGAFLRDEKGFVYLAHSGRVGGGRKGVGKKEFLASFSGSVVEASGGKYIIVGRLEADDFIRRVATFVKAVEAFKQGTTVAVPPEDDGDEEENVWLFQANPRRGYNLAEDVKQQKPGATDWWTVSRYHSEMQEGDRVLLWQAGDAAGIYAIGSLVGTPVEQDGENPYSSDQNKRMWWRVPFRYDKIVEPALTKSEAQADDVLSGLQVLQIPQGTNFRVTPEEWDRLQKLLSGELPRQPREPAAKLSYWKIAPERNARLWDPWREGGYASIGWGDLGDISGIDRDQFDKGLEAALERNPDWTRAGVEQVWRFRNIPVGSRIVANDGTRRVVGIGTVTGPYSYHREEDDHRHRLPVRWDDVRPRAVERGGWRRTLIQLKKADFEEILEAPPPEAVSLVKSQDEVEPVDKLDFEGLYAALGNLGLYFPEEVVASYLLALQTKRFVILSGISGTGKTRLAIEIAKVLQGKRSEDLPPQPGDLVPIRVHPYSITYKRFALPAAFVQRTPGLMERALETKSMTLRYPAGEQTVSVYKPPHASSLFLLLSGDAASWYVHEFEAGDKFYVRLEEDEDGYPTIVNLLTERETPPAPQRRYVIVAVRPDWTDRHGLLGYYNPLTKEYQSTPFLDLLLDARDEQERARKEGRPPRPYFVVLDEMNLARVEHYFSDFLSCLESGEPIHLHDDLDLDSEAALTIPRQVHIPRNLFFTGTVNIDETTYMFSPKVLDRAFTLEFNEVDLVRFGTDSTGVDDSERDSTPLRLETFDGALAIPALDAQKGDDKSRDWKRFRSHVDGKLAEVVLGLNERLQTEHRHFGYRVANEISRFVNLAADQAGKKDEVLWAALDVAVLSKVLPKLHGTQQELEGILATLFAYGINLDGKLLDGKLLDGKLLDGKLLDGKLEETASDIAWKVADGQLVLRETESAPLVPALPRTAMKLWRMLKRLRQQGFTSFIE